MEKLITNLKERIRRVPKGKLIAISVSIKVIQVAVSTYLIKRFFFN